MADAADTNRGTKVARTDTLGVASTWNTAGSIGWSRSSAAATWVSSTTGSLSRRSTEIHPTPPCRCSLHCARSVVFP
jgi:hypothetical protein